MPSYHSDPKITSRQIREQRDRILASKVFSRSKRQSAFLEYVINAALNGQTDQLKEFTLGIDVFEKDESFDPGTDSIVRVEAIRLRGKLRDYYLEDGAGDSVIIDIPKGQYAPIFQLTNMAKTDHQSPSQASRLWLGVTVAILIIGLIYTIYQMPRRESNLTAETQQLPSPSSIAVLPLRDFSSEPEDFFSEAMTDGLIASLAKVRALRVTSLTSVMRYKNTDIPIPEIGRTLDVAYIVEGSLIRDDNKVRVTAQLIAADVDEHIWSTTLDLLMPDILSVQHEVATAIAAQISSELLPSPQSHIGGQNPAAYEAYMKGRYFYNQFTANGYRRGLKFFQQAIEIEPDYAEAYAGLASCHCLLASHGLEMVSPVVSLPQAHAHAMKALSLDSELAEPMAFLGIIDFKFGWNVEAARIKLERAIAMNPSLYQAYVWHSQILEAMGRHDEAVNRARYAKRLNPLSLAANLNLGWQLYQAGNYIEASTEIDSLIEFNPQFWGGHWVRGHIYNRHQMYDKAIIEFQKAVELEGGHSLPLSALGYTFAVAGKHDDARRIIAELDALSRDNYVSPFHVATVYAGLNETDPMFEWLDRAYQVRARSLAWLQAANELKPYHDDDRFQNLLKRIGIFSGVKEREKTGRDL